MKRMVWFRRDLRVHDNPALWHACQGNDGQHVDVIAVSFICRKQWRQHGMGDRLIQLTINAMKHLEQQLQALNIPLLIIDSDTFSDNTQALQTLCTDLKIDQLYFNYEYEINEINRDMALNHWADNNRAFSPQLFCYHDQCIIPPGQVLNKQQQMFKVYSPFRKAWCQHFPQFQQPPLNKPVQITSNHFVTKEAETAVNLLVSQTSAEKLGDEASAEEAVDSLWPINEELAHQQLQNFLQQRASDYHNWRDFPAKPATSRLSCYLSLGLLSGRQCLYSAWQMNACMLTDGEPGLNGWINEIIWREFYRHLLVAFPDLNKHKAFKPDTESVPWRYSKTDFDAWCQGKTGYPIVDAAQRQLLETGWMHNRLRMISAMFLTKHLLIDWRWGESWFASHLVDFDLASNNGGWQWSASTGADGAPYFRIFNPITQSQKFDPDGEFIAQFVPELATLPVKARHQPNAIQRSQCGYANEIVEHKFARLRALAAFKGEGLLTQPGVDEAPPETDLFTLTGAGAVSSEKA